MCGISGIINLTKTAVSQQDVKIMNGCIPHRGPDADGFYFSGQVGFGHRRLSILDLSELGAQPMKYGDEGYVITYNGEVFNYIEIRHELAALGYKFKSGSDTEVMLAAYQEWGEACVHHFNGMWAFAIHDSRKNRVFISRDRFGVKPLNYSINDGRLFFGSEIRQLLAVTPYRKVNKQILFDYLFLGFHHHTSETFFENIYSLDPGHNMIIDLANGQVTINRWYELKVNDSYAALPFDDAQKLFEATIDDAIHLRLRSDVKVGTCLSGGLDSSYISTVAAREYNQKASGKFTAITAKSIESETDESAFAEQVARNADLNWKTTQPTTEDFLKAVDDVITTQEEPFGSPSIVMQYFVMKKAKEEGCIVMLDGQGGDEALLGYDRYYAAYINQQRGWLGKLKGIFTIAKNSKLSVRDVVMYTLYFNSRRIRAIRQLRRNAFVKAEFKRYLNYALLDQLSANSKKIPDLQKFEITKVQLQKLLKYEDRNSMRFSIEARVPFIDYRVIELAYSLPFDHKMREGWSKYILRKSSASKLPQEIVWRKNKFGFEAPTKTWLADRESFFSVVKESPFLDSFIDKEKLSLTMDEITLWKLYNLAVWAKKFDVTF